jgi:hypothetical protein
VEARARVEAARAAARRCMGVLPKVAAVCPKPARRPALPAERVPQKWLRLCDQKALRLLNREHDAIVLQGRSLPPPL